MSEAIVRSPFHKLDLRDQLRLDPLHLAHLLGCDPSAPSCCAKVQQVAEGALVRAQRFELRGHFAADVGRPVPCPFAPSGRSTSGPQLRAASAYLSASLRSLTALSTAELAAS